MHAVLEIDHEFLVNNLVNARRAIPLRRLCKLRHVNRHRQVRVSQLQVRRLAFFMIGEAERHVRQTVKAEFSIRLWIINRLVRIDFFGRLRIRFAMFQRSKERELEDRLEPHIETTQSHTAQWSEFSVQRRNIAHTL